MPDEKFTLERHFLDGGSKSLSLEIGMSGTDRRKRVEEVTSVIKGIDHLRSNDFASMAIRFLTNDALAIACTTSQALLWVLKSRPEYVITEDGTLKKVEVKPPEGGSNDGLQTISEC